MVKRLTEIDILYNKAVKIKAKIDYLTDQLNAINAEVKELSKPGFKIPKPKKSKYY